MYKNVHNFKICFLYRLIHSDTFLLIFSLSLFVSVPCWCKLFKEADDTECVRRMIQSNIALVPFTVLWKIGDSSKWFVGEITIIGSWHDTDSHTATIGYSSGIQCVWALLSPWKHRSVRSICWPSDSCYTYYCSHQLHRLQQIPSTSDTLFAEKLKRKLCKSIFYVHVFLYNEPSFQIKKVYSQYSWFHSFTICVTK